MKIDIRLRSVLAGLLLVATLVEIILFMKSRRPVFVPPLPHVAGASVSHGSLKVRGPETAPVKIVEYSDFQCPSCRAVQPYLESLFKSYPGKIQLTFKHFPLNSHQWSIYAHQAAECMNRQGKFWLYQDTLYSKQVEWAPSKVAPVEILARYAKELGADMTRFGACMADVAVARDIYAEKDEGNKRQVSATPTFFLGEKRFVGPKEMLERGDNAFRQVLGLPPKPSAAKKVEPLVPKPLAGAAK